LGFHTDATAAPTATNDINGENLDSNIDATDKKAKGQAQVDEGTQNPLCVNQPYRPLTKISSWNKRCNTYIFQEKGEAKINIRSSRTQVKKAQSKEINDRGAPGCATRRILVRTDEGLSSLACNNL
jgi:hypothetical protein